MKKFSFKRITSLLMTLLILCGCIINNDCFAANKPTLTYEQLTKRYPAIGPYADSARRSIKGNWYPPSSSRPLP